jgi:hypothetical protein
MTDKMARLARLMNVVEAVVAELNRQGVLEAIADRGFDPLELAKAAVSARTAM